MEQEPTKERTKRRDYNGRGLQPDKKKSDHFESKVGPLTKESVPSKSASDRGGVGWWSVDFGTSTVCGAAIVRLSLGVLV